MPAHTGLIRTFLLPAALALLSLLVCSLQISPAQRPVVERASAAPPALGSPARTVRVAAIQCPSQMGKLRDNRTRLTELITTAAKHGAKIVVLPECAVHGYYDPLDDAKWTRRAEPDSNELPVAGVAEHIPGPSTRYFGDLAKGLGIYLTVPLIECSREQYFNTLVLIAPDGTLAATHRKNSLWMVGDSSWASEGTGTPQVVNSPYGRLGLMICHDYQTMPKRLRGRADIVLYSVGWYGANTEGWYSDTFPLIVVKPNGFAVIAANWSASTRDELWQGVGYSTIYTADGTVVAMSSRTSGNDIVYGDLPIALGAVKAATVAPLALDDE